MECGVMSDLSVSVSAAGTLATEAHRSQMISCFTLGFLNKNAQLNWAFCHEKDESYAFGGFGAFSADAF